MSAGVPKGGALCYNGTDGGERMKRLAALLLASLLLLGSAAAEGFQSTALRQTEGMTVFPDEDSACTVIRPAGQPFSGHTEDEWEELTAYLDFVEDPDEDMTLLRLTVSLVSDRYLAASRLTVTAGDTDYVFEVNHLVSEYDMVYYEDYAVCLSDESLPMLRALARGRESSFAVALEGQETVRGEISLPPEEAARLYDLYIDLGGKAQRLDLLRDRWPVRTVKK